MPSLRLDSVSLQFRVRPAGRAGLKDLFVRGREIERVNPLTVVEALKDVSGHVITLADAEDLPAHGEAIRRRFER